MSMLSKLAARAIKSMTADEAETLAAKKVAKRAAPAVKKTAAKPAAKKSLAAQPRRVFEEFGVKVRDIPETAKRAPVREVKASAVKPAEVSLEDYVGRPFITTMADRSAAQSQLTGVGRTKFDEPVELLGGQDFMLDPTSSGLVWASHPAVVKQMLEQARVLEKEYGKKPLYLPFRMSGSGSDFSNMTGETMMSFAVKNMGKKAQKTLDKTLREEVPGLQDFKGIGTAEGMQQYRDLPGRKRVQFAEIMDRFAPEGGLTMGQTRLAIADPTQLDAPKFQLQNVGEVDTARDMLLGTGHPAYAGGLYGAPEGRLREDVNVAELLPALAERYRIDDPSSYAGSPTKLSPEEIASSKRKRMDLGQLLRTTVQSGFLDEPTYEAFLKRRSGR